MKLLEIAPIAPSKFHAKPDKVTKPTHYGKEDIEDLGAGVFATAHSTKTEPGTVRKISRGVHDLDHDGYFQYVKMLATNDRFTNNPYFPKIYDIKVQKDPEHDKKTSYEIPDDEDPEMYEPPGPYSFSVDIERLHNFRSLGTEEAWQLGGRLIKDFEDYAYQKGTGMNAGRYRFAGTSGEPDPRLAISWYVKELQRGMKRHLDKETFKGFAKKGYVGTRGDLQKLPNIKDPKFKEAMMLIAKVNRQQAHFHGDLHMDNIMVRRGPGGPHLVFNDPIA